MRILNTAIYLTLILILFACKNLNSISEAPNVVLLDTIEVPSDNPYEKYRPSESRLNDLIHTKLEVSFNWDSAFLYGKAYLKFSPYFFPTDSLILDAKGFQIHDVSLLDSLERKSKLDYGYDKERIFISLDKQYKRSDTFHLFVSYTAMPNKLAEGGSEAITSDKGLYFINPKGEEPNKPRQIWTQGETEASSCWFPTIDSPNERSTQEIFITVDSNFKTLSNGSLIFQLENEDGSRTDYWKQEQAHAPYLFMMAIGEYAIVKDNWKDKEVNYYVEEKYKEFARQIFPHTPEMLEFFSQLLSYDYPWDKFSQVVVRDYVSGAMENSSAVIYGEFVQGDEHYLADYNGEDIVAHELFHHWFGDLVTCESWSNLPLNEAFATYGEYLWFEHKHGKYSADHKLEEDLQAYFSESRINAEKLIRFHYADREDMFDSHSYQKGGRILHMLRKYLGDEAFFQGLNLYLKTHEYQSVEVHDLRLAFEKVCGEDLNWFFNQWFLSAGHPILEVSYNYIDSSKTLEVSILQTQSGGNIPEVFRLPTELGIINADGELIQKNIVLNKRSQTISIPMEHAPKGVNLDVSKSLLADIIQDFNKEEAIALYHNFKDYKNQLNALNVLQDLNDSSGSSVLFSALSHPFWHIRLRAIESSEQLKYTNKIGTLNKLKLLAKEDANSKVRAAAILALASHFKEEVDLNLFKEGLKDVSYMVVSSSLDAIYRLSPDEGISIAEELEKTDNYTLQAQIAQLYAEEGAEKRYEFFKKNINEANESNRYAFILLFSEFLTKQETSLMSKSLTIFKEQINSETWYIRYASVIALQNLASVMMQNQQILQSANNQSQVGLKTDKVHETELLINDIGNILMERESIEQNDLVKKLIPIN